MCRCFFLLLVSTGNITGWNAGMRAIVGGRVRRTALQIFRAFTRLHRSHTEWPHFPGPRSVVRHLAGKFFSSHSKNLKHARKPFSFFDRKKRQRDPIKAQKKSSRHFSTVPLNPADIFPMQIFFSRVFPSHWCGVVWCGVLWISPKNRPPNLSINKRGMIRAGRVIWNFPFSLSQITHATSYVNGECYHTIGPFGFHYCRYWMKQMLDANFVRFVFSVTEEINELRLNKAETFMLLAVAIFKTGRCGVVWCGVVWCGVVWCGVVWCGVVWCGVVCGVVWCVCGVMWCGVVWCGVVCGVCVVWCGVVWCGVVCGVVWCGVVWCVV